MARCNSCNGVLTRSDYECYVCGEPVPGKRRPSPFLKWLFGPGSKQAGPAVKEAVAVPAVKPADSTQPGMPVSLWH